MHLDLQRAASPSLPATLLNQIQRNNWEVTLIPSLPKNPNYKIQIKVHWCCAPNWIKDWSK